MLQTALVATVAIVCATAAIAEQTAATNKSSRRALSLENKPWKGDFDGMLERRVIRVDVPFSRSLYYVDKGRERGIAGELLRDFEQFLNRKYAKVLGKRPLTIYIVVATRDKLLPDLAAGLADLSAGNLTVTEDRLRVADFVAGDDRKPMTELLVTGPSAPSIANVDELSGKTIHVRKTSSYYDSLVALNARLNAAGKPEAKLVFVPDALEDEDMMEMVNAGLLQAIVVDDWKARAWAQVLPKLVVRKDIVLRDDAYVGWAIRKDSPKFAAEIRDFYHNWAKKQGVIEHRFAQHMKRVKQLKDATASSERKRFETTLDLFRKYAAQYDFDPLMLAAQGYQESTLDQTKRSHVGAVGVMQIMPATGAELRVGDIHQIEPNIHGGAKYMDQLMSKYFADAKFDAQNRTLFAFASYNCGPGNVAKARRAAEKRGLDPNRWFNNVEIVVAEQIGAETTTYVRNIYKYYVAYKLVSDADELRRSTREQIPPGK